MSDTFWVPYGILFQEFHEFQPKRVQVYLTQWPDHFQTDSMIKILWTLAAFLVMAAYCGNLKTQLIVQDYEDYLETLEQLLYE